MGGLVQDFLRRTSDPNFVRRFQERIERERKELTQEEHEIYEKMNEQYRKYKKSLTN